MPIPIDDLVASLTTSLNSNHIGQEATDLATLQTQLNLTLKHPSYHPSTHNQHPNTPTQTSATWSFPPPTDPHPPLNYRSKRYKPGQRSRAHSFAEDAEEMMLIDEEEVEQLLDACSPTDSTPSHKHTEQFPQQQRLFIPQQYPDTPASPSTSFAATDPFYATLSSRNHHFAFQGAASQPIIAPQSAFFSQHHPLQANQ